MSICFDLVGVNFDYLHDNYNIMIITCGIWEMLKIKKDD